MAAQPHRILGQGHFGLVFVPALPNENTEGNPINVSGQVTKVMFRKSNYNSTMARINAMRPLLPTLNHPNAYHKAYTMANLPPEIRKAAAVKTGSTANTDPIYAMRMPYRGVDLFTLATTQDPALKAKINAIPPAALANGILNLMKTVEAIKDAGFIHGDIREPNVLCDLETGALTLIDFDWMLRRDTYLATYPSFAYSHPPEEIFTLTKSPSAGLPLDRVRAAVTPLWKHLWWVPKSDRERWIEGVVNAHTWANTPKKIANYQTRNLDTVDSYGLGVALYALAASLTPPDDPDNPVAILQHELQHTICPTLTQHINDFRPLINQVIEIWEEIMRSDMRLTSPSATGTTSASSVKTGGRRKRKTRRVRKTRRHH